MFLLVFQSLYFFLPAYAAKVVPLLFSQVSFGKKHVHPKIMISPKELVLAALASTLVFFFQKWLYAVGLQILSFIDYDDFSILLGVLMGIGVVIGDAWKNYYKQKDGILLTKSWLPWDAWGYVVGGIVFSFFEYVPDVLVVIILLVSSPLFHFLWGLARKG